MVVRFDVGLGLDFTVHTSVYNKVPVLPPGLVVVVDVVLHDPTPSHFHLSLRMEINESMLCQGMPEPFGGNITRHRMSPNTVTDRVD